MVDGVEVKEKKLLSESRGCEEANNDGGRRGGDQVSGDGGGGVDEEVKEHGSVF